MSETDTAIAAESTLHLLTAAIGETIEETARFCGVTRAAAICAMSGALAAFAGEIDRAAAGDFFNALGLRLAHGEECAELNSRRVTRTAGALIAIDKKRAREG